MINREFIELLKQTDLGNTPSQIARGIVFGFLITYKDDFPALKDYLLDESEHRPIFPYDQFQEYQINLCKTNPETLKLELKVPLFSGLQQGDFDKFLNLLLLYNVNSKGHLNHQLSFVIFDADVSVDKKALEHISRYEGFSLTRAVEVIAKYYETTEFATKLSKYLLSNNFKQDYNEYEQSNS